LNVLEEKRMRIERLFNVLVLGGAALAGCGDDEEGGAGDTRSAGQGAAGPAGNGPATGNAAATSGAGGQGGSTEQGPGGAGVGGAPVCSEPASPTDPCGCPCCWVLDCLNTEECCTGWCGSCC
jgi:hypothetical protein